MGIFYVHPADFIRERRFEVLAPSYYHPHISSDVLLGGVEKPKQERVNPYRFVTVGRQTPPRPSMVLPGQHADQHQHCYYTAEIMVDMFRKRIPFDIVHDVDIVELMDGVDRYLVSLKADIQAEVVEAIEYTRLLLAWREQLYKHYFRYMKTHPTAMEELYPNFDKQNNIFSLLLAVGSLGIEETNLDPLKARQTPPVTLDIRASKTSTEITQTEAEQEITNPFASAHNEKFDLQDFLKGT